ncbi:cell wall integrity and stress response component 4 isoform X2 [Mastacembelus armatus]|nr:cell wall integrity and stress response component 4-like isoform X2 [Mastacembelus armatus]
MAMESSFAMACCLLAISSALNTQMRNLTTTTTTTNLTHATTSVSSSSPTRNATAGSNTTEDTSPFPSSTTWGNQTFNESTSEPSATITTPLTKSTSLMTAAPHTPTATTAQTAAGYTGTPDVTATTTANPPHTVNTTSDTDNKSQGLGLNTSEKNLTIVFSVILGLFAVAIIVLVLHKCKQKLQYMHQPLNNSSDTEMFVADDDTLVISGGLYDGHPIYDDVPTAPAEQSQFRLEFLH